MFRVIGDEKLPSYVGGFFINHYMDPVLKQPVNFMEAVSGRVFLTVAHLLFVIFLGGGH